LKSKQQFSNSGNKIPSSAGLIKSRLSKLLASVRLVIAPDEFSFLFLIGLFLSSALSWLETGFSLDKIV